MNLMHIIFGDYLQAMYFLTLIRLLLINFRLLEEGQYRFKKRIQIVYSLTGICPTNQSPISAEHVAICIYIYASGFRVKYLEIFC